MKVLALASASPNPVQARNPLSSRAWLHRLGRPRAHLQALRLPWAQLQLKPKRLLLPQAWQLPRSQASAGTSTTWPYSRPHVQPHLHVGPFTCSFHKGGPISFAAQNSPQLHFQQQQLRCSQGNQSFLHHQALFSRV